VLVEPLVVAVVVAVQVQTEAMPLAVMVGPVVQ
jgi:hypothetical protein